MQYNIKLLGVVAHAGNFSIPEAEVGRSLQVWGQSVHYKVNSRPPWTTWWNPGSKRQKKKIRTKQYNKVWNYEIQNIKVNISSQGSFTKKVCLAYACLKLDDYHKNRKLMLWLLWEINFYSWAKDVSFFISNNIKIIYPSQWFW